MFRNYLKTAWRVLVRNKVFSLINVLGLALGIACSLLIALWVLHERSIDNFHAANETLYQVYERNHYDGKTEASYPTQGLLAEELKKAIPEIQYASGYEYAAAPGTQNTFEAANKVNKASGAFAGEDFFKMFSYPLLQGTAQTALNKYESVAISRKMAEQFFGSADAAIGKTMRFENKEDLLVTAVFENVTDKSSLRFDFLRSWSAFVKQNEWVHNWGNTDPQTFVKLRTDANGAAVEAKVKDFIYRYQQRDKSFVVELGLQPYGDRYLHSTFKEGKPDGGRIDYVRLFSLVAIFILLIACINFMNLATARSAVRAKEVGVRKVIGANVLSLTWQFIGEAMLLCFISSLVALLLAAVCLPAFNNLSGKDLSLPFSQPIFWAALFLLIVVSGFVAGSYPALFLSSLNPVKVLKTGLRFGRSAVLFRKALVVFQFALSVILIVGMVVIYRQMDYVQSKNLGYDRDNLLYIPIEGDLIKNYTVFKQEASKIPGVQTISKMRNSPTVIEHHTTSIDWEGKDPNLSVSFADAVVGYDFAKTMQLKLKEGRDFAETYGTDSTSYLLNETAVAKIGYQNPVGKTVSWGNRKGVIVGVLQDFHFASMHQAIDPLIVRLDENWGWGTILVRIKGAQTKAAIAGLQDLCKTINPKIPFTYSFSDEEFRRLYTSEQTVSKLSNWAAFLGIFISCLGLFGLAMFTASQRTKEIGVRKVLGASVSNIAALLITNFLKPVFIAIVIAIPVARYFMKNWLEGFAYKIEMSWWVFGLAGLIAIVIALSTVGFQAIKSAIANPVKSLRTE